MIKKFTSLFFCLLLLGSLCMVSAAEPTITDELGNLDKPVDKSDGWQLDASLTLIGSWINKMGNNDVQYVTYKMDNIKDFTLTIVSYVSEMSRPKSDVKIYLSKDGSDWNEIKFSVSKATEVSAEWSTYEITPSKSIGDGISYVKFELQVLSIASVANCYVTGFKKVELFNTVQEAAPTVSSEPAVSRPTTGQITPSKAPATAQTASATAQKYVSAKSGSNTLIWVVVGGFLLLIAVNVTGYVLVLKKKKAE